MLEAAFLDLEVRIDRDKASCPSVVRYVALKLAVFHVEHSVVEHDDARHFAVGLGEQTTAQTPSVSQY